MQEALRPNLTRNRVASDSTATLAELPLGASGRVKALRSRGLTRRRLLDLGLVPGTQVKVLLRSPAGDPRAYLVRGAMLALRDTDARDIAVEPDKVVQEA